MSQLKDIVKVTISRETQAISVAGFGTMGIISEFAPNKTTSTFDRYRVYGDLTEMSDDGWSSLDAVYQAASKALSQNPVIDKIMIGRIDEADATITDGLNQIQAATGDWYCWDIVATPVVTFDFSVDFITGNLIDLVINGLVVTQVPFNTDQATTMADLKAQIEADVPDSVATVDGNDISVAVFGGVQSATGVVTGGASQPTTTITFDIEDDIKECAAWNQTQKKIFFYATANTEAKNPASEDDLPWFMKNLAYDRTVSIFHPDSQDGITAPSWIESAMPGEALPFDPGSQTWAYKTLAGIPAYPLTAGERTALLDKNCNIYTVTAGVNVTEEGKVASGDYIDVIRGLDWLEARLQEAVFTNLVNKRKIPYTDEGIALIENAVVSVLAEGERVGLLVPGLSVVTVPKAADVSSVDKIARLLKNVNFTAVLQGAIQTVEIDGNVAA